MTGKPEISWQPGDPIPCIRQEIPEFKDHMLYFRADFRTDRRPCGIAARIERFVSSESIYW